MFDGISHVLLKRVGREISRLALLVLVAGFLPGTLAATEVPGDDRAPILTLSENRSEYLLGPYLEILEDPGGQLTIGQASEPAAESRFEPNRVAIPNFGFTDSAYWLRLRVRNATGKDGEWLLELGFSNMHRVDFYRPGADDNGFEAVRTGVLRGFASRDLPHHRFVFRVPLKAGEQIPLYLRFENGASMTLPLTLWTVEAFRQQSGLELLTAGLFYGALLVLLGYNLFLVVFLRDRGYLYFVLFLAGVSLAQVSYDGLANQYLWPGTPMLSRYTVPLFTVLTLLMVLRLTNAVLDTRRQTPLLHRLTLLWQGLAVIIVIQVPVFDYGIVMLQVALLVLFSFVTLPVIALLAWRNGYRPARYFTLAWGTLMVTVIAHFLNRLGVAPSNFLTEHGYQFGLVILVLLVSLGLADRINTLKRDKRAAQHALARAQRVSTMGEMAASIAHELNQPLAAIVANAGSVRRLLDQGKGLSDQVPQILEHLADDSLRAGETLHRMRRLFEKGELNAEPVDINATVTDALDLLQTDTRAKGMSVSTRLEAGLAPLAGDQLQLQQVLVNLLTNAMEAGASVVTVETSMGREYEVVVEVADNGSGIGEALRQRVFDPFFTSKSDGMGMGLAICRGIIEAHRGRLWMEPCNGAGTRFGFALPVDR